MLAPTSVFKRHFPPGCVLSHAFGPTECLTVCWALIPHGTPAAEGKLPIGYSLPDKDVLLLDESRREVADGSVGEIAVKSRYISPGYWRDAEQTRAAFCRIRTAATRDLYDRRPWDAGARRRD